ncbi:MAG: radical SAM protein [Planctomycetes bacterium]|nr:radical SAM protein [Planctomycetota bacterium]
MTRILLVNPKFPDSFWSFRWAFDNVLTGQRAMTAPLGLATVAALSPSAWDVAIADEDIEPLPADPDVDIVGICGMGVQFERQMELVRHYRSRGYYVVVGGAYASLCPELYEGRVDTVISGEAEYVWPEFCRDFEAGEARALYKEEGTVDLADSPMPRFDLLKLEHYYTMPLQFSRGCPFQCEFCDIIVMFGRKPRLKSIDQVMRELEELRRLGVNRPFFVDDNFIGNRAAAKGLLRAISNYQRERGSPFRFGTEASINIAQDPELLDLMRSADFGWLFVGIETSSEAALAEVKKTQNLRVGLLESVGKIHAAGIDVFGGFIIGFDSDDRAAIERQHRFIIDSGMAVAIVNLLSAIPKTPLHDRVAREGRLLEGFHGHIGSNLGTNIVPKRMSFDEMLAAYRDLCLEVSSDRQIAERIRNKLRRFGAPPNTHRGSLPFKLLQLARLLVRGILPGGWRRVYHFLRTLRSSSPAVLYSICADWTMALAIRDYVRRQFAAGDSKSTRHAKRMPVVSRPPQSAVVEPAVVLQRVAE